MISNSGTSTLGLYDFKRQIDAFGGVDYFRQNLAGGYLKNARVMLANGDIVKNTIADNTANPNVDMTGWKFNDNTVESIADLIDIPNPKDGQVVFVFSYRSGWAVEAIYHVPKGGGQFVYNSAKSAINDGIHCFNGWERIDYDKYYVDTDIAGFHGNGVDDDYPAFKRLHSYLLTLESQTGKIVEFKSGNFLIKSLDESVVVYGIYGWLSIVPISSNTMVFGAGKSLTTINIDFDYLAWMYSTFTDGSYNLREGLLSNPSLSVFGLTPTHGSTCENTSISDMTVKFNGDRYYYSAADGAASQQTKAFCQVSLCNWNLDTISNAWFTDIKIDKNPSMQNIGFNYNQAEASDIYIIDVDHYKCGESSSVNNKCPDHSSIYCHGGYTLVRNNKFVGSRASTINCALEFHGSGDIIGNTFVDTAACIYVVNLQNYQGGSYREKYDNNTVNVKGNIVDGGIYALGYANGGTLVINASDNTFKTRKEKSNRTWVGGNVFVHSGVDARGLVNLNETPESNTTLNLHGNTFEQEDVLDWGTEDNYINACISLKNIQTLNVTKNTFSNYKGCVLVLEKFNQASKKPNIKFSGNTYINCGSNQDSSSPNLVTDALYYVSSANILNFTDSTTNKVYGELYSKNETFINCKYKRIIAQQSLLTLFTKVEISLSNSDFLAPVSFVHDFGGNDSFTDYSFNLNFDKMITAPYGFGEVLLGYMFDINYSRKSTYGNIYFKNKCVKLSSLDTISTISDLLNDTTMRQMDIPNGISISDRDVVYFPLNRSDEVQKLNYNSSTLIWA